MNYKRIFVTKKLYNNDFEKISIKNGYIHDTKKIQRAKMLKRLEKENELKKITPKGQLDIERIKRYEIEKAKFDRKYAPKLENAIRSMNRAKNNLMDILRCNEFDFFVTLTFNKNKIDRLNDNETRKAFTQWTNNITRDLHNLIYVAVPEYHKKGGLHFHLLMGGVTAEDLKLVDSGKCVKSGRCKGQIIYNITKWKKGYSTATKILDTNAVKYYLSKYLTKGKVDPRFFNKKRFYVSRNINRPQIEKYAFEDNENFNVFDSIPKDCYNIEYEDNTKGYCVLSRSLKE